MAGGLVGLDLGGRPVERLLQLLLLHLRSFLLLRESTKHQRMVRIARANVSAERRRCRDAAPIPGASPARVLALGRDVVLRLEPALRARAGRYRGSRGS